MLAGAAVIFAGSVFFLVLAYLRRRRTGLPLLGERETLATTLVVVFGIVIPVVTLAGLFTASNIFILQKTDAPAVSSTQMTVHVVGHQWWWEVRYPGSEAVTANEIHIPTNTRVNLVVTTADVIHSFWVPRLNRKIDLIPGQENRILLYTDKAGRYRGQCAEFCGLQHAHMAFYVFAEPPDRFRAWLAHEAAPAPAPRTADERKGEDVFLSNACASCHTIRGTDANGQIGPDLTHVAERTTLAAGTIPNRTGYLAGWILDPQHVKPGNKMPGLNLAGPDFQALLQYVDSLGFER
jgi:cytochrome c oxidase subunit 2